MANGRLLSSGFRFDRLPAEQNASTYRSVNERSYNEIKPETRQKYRSRSPNDREKLTAPRGPEIAAISGDFTPFLDYRYCFYSENSFARKYRRDNYQRT